MQSSITRARGSGYVRYRAIIFVSAISPDGKHVADQLLERGVEGGACENDSRPKQILLWRCQAAADVARLLAPELSHSPKRLEYSFD
jgi:hypothetical protein